MSYTSWGIGLAVAVMTVATPVRVDVGCEWKPEVLSLAEDTEQGKVTAGDGGWLSGVAWGESAGQGVLWHDGRMTVLGAAFGLDTYLHAVNADGVAVGQVSGDGSYHAIRYRHGGYEYLPETAGSSRALDVNAGGDTVGYDGATTIVVWQDGGSVRALPMPPGEFPSGWPVINDDGSVVAWTGSVDADGTFHRRGYTWAPAGTRAPLSSFAVAVNQAPGDESQLWSPGEVPATLPAPAGHRAGGVAVLDGDQAGGYSFPDDEDGSRPVRWLCR
jgi:hypothetical protein